MPAKPVVSEAQWRVILAYMQEHPDVARGTVANDGTLAKRSTNDAWEVLASRLNCVGIGATKTSNKWRDYWNNAKYAARKKACARRQQAHRTGDGTKKPVAMTDREEAIVALVGRAAVHGDDEETDRKPFDDLVEVRAASSPSPALAPQSPEGSEPRPAEYVDMTPADLLAPPSPPPLHRQPPLHRRRRPGTRRTYQRIARHAAPEWFLQLEQRRINNEEQMAAAVNNVARTLVSVGGQIVSALDEVARQFARIADERGASNMSLQRLTALRALMASQPTALSAYIIPTADAHNSEYIAEADARREWVSEFTGSAGTAVVTAAHALLWTDGRYYTQFLNEADLTLWTLMKQSLPETLSMEKWLVKNLVEGSVVGADPHTMTREEWTPLQTALSKANMRLVGVPSNLVDAARAQLEPAPPLRTHNPIIPLSVKYTGKTAGQKIEELRSKMAEKKAAALVITALDEIAYTLNLRGSDIDYNPIFFSYLVITATTADLFWGEGVLTEEVKGHLKWEGVELSGKPYADITGYLVNMARELSESGDCSSSVWLSSEASEAIHQAAAGGDEVKKPLCLISEVSPVALAKLIKNDVELEGFRNCHIRDGIAVSRFFRWLHEQLDSGATVTEVQAADKLLEFREDEADFIGPSFGTIAGAGANGAIIHYAPHPDTAAVIKRDDMFLLDSGGQYRDGTTDITRTRHMSGSPTAEQRDAFTRVLKGQISVGSALFPQGVKGNVLDSFARRALWDVGLDYAHGTGHGVGHALCVHEGPAGVSWRPYPHDPGLRPGQILSNEPGYYKVGEYGIRHEDLVETIAVTKDSLHPRAGGLLGDYDGRGVLGFHTLTLVPNQRASMDVSLLDDFELAYINAYHKRVLDTLGPIMDDRGLAEDKKWLEAECAPISRG